jgi:hypothetical protein
MEIFRGRKTIKEIFIADYLQGSVMPELSRVMPTVAQEFAWGEFTEKYFGVRILGRWFWTPCDDLLQSVRYGRHGWANSLLQIGSERFQLWI